MNKFKHYLGIDVSKEYFDAVIILNSNKNTTVHNQFTNDSNGLRNLISWLKSHDSTSANTLVCLEHTGMYGKIIIHHLLAKDFKLWVEMSLKIIRSIGVQRGKNDKIDASRIAYYAMKNFEEIQYYEPPRKIVEKIRKLIALREHLVTTANLLNVSPNYLGSLLKSLTGLTTQQHIHEKLIDKAKEKLSTTQLSVSEIAYELGFEHPQSFSKLFKTKTNVSPLEFRQSFN